jgi:alpha-beta hydrolase superfamily lysophospholipase
MLQGFWKHTIDLGSDYDGPITATLVRRPKERSRECAVLYVHGYVDYFLQPHLADFYEDVPVPGTTRDGCDFFALDLRKYGRSLPRGYPYPNFAKNLDEYFTEIRYALRFIKSEGYRFVLLNGHSTGALVVARYLQDEPQPSDVDAVFLNSPFLGFNDRDLSPFRERVARFLGRMAPHSGGKSTVPLWYARSLLRRSDTCADCHGRWTFDVHLKPIKGFKVFLGWVRAILIGQERARRGGIRQPILILHSARSNNGTDSIWHEEYRRADLVLDVEDIKTGGPKLGVNGGENVTVRPIEGGVHDLSLSDPDALARTFGEVTAWLRGLR